MSLSARERFFFGAQSPYWKTLRSTPEGDPAEQLVLVGDESCGGRVLAPFNVTKDQSIPCGLASCSPSCCFCLRPVLR